MNFSSKQLFLIDGVGALVSAILLGVVLVQFEPYFGMPKRVLYLLAAIPCVFALYDFICYFGAPNDYSKWLRVIAIGNVLYCVLSLYFTIIYFEQLTTLGHLYFLSEIAIVLFLARLEWRAVKKDR
jgi:hypothetical protein